MGSALDLLKLTDRYERKARLLPALLSVLALAPAAGALSPDSLTWLVSLPIGLGVVAVCAVGLSYAASAAGRRYELLLWPHWPDDSPTNRWLHPDDTASSQQQKQLWYDAIKRLVGLDIPDTVGRGDESEVKQVINDAVRTLRHEFRNTEHSGLLASHNEDYGFARNFAGLRVFWLPASVASVVATWAAYLFMESALMWGVLALVILSLSLLLLCIMPGYVRQRAERYAESFFGTLSAVDKAAGDRSSVR